MPERRVDWILSTDRGRTHFAIPQIQSYSATKVVNAPGSATMTLPSRLVEAILTDYIQRDSILQLHVNGRLWNTYFLGKSKYTYDDQGRTLITLSGYDQNILLCRRVVAAYEESAQAAMEDYADDMMKAVVTDMMQDDADPTPEAGTRAWGNLGVATDRSNGPSIKMSFPFDYILKRNGGGVLAKIAEASRAAGTEVFFWVRPSSVGTASIKYQFRTYTGQPGHDLTKNNWMQTIFSAENGSLVDAELIHDFTSDVNYFYVLGAGDAADQTVDQVYDAERYNSSYWARTEGIVRATGKADDELEAEGQAELSRRRDRKSLRGTPIDGPNMRLVVRYDVGDRVVAQGFGEQFDAIVWGGRLYRDEDGREGAEARLEYRA
ncbi:MAG: hypothetical protein GF364_22760 [Candidatus Lokiarchaeota archaeon]|nr:hypothetical protein [Candidatus Lokiarchaeota archaeon]